VAGTLAGEAALGFSALGGGEGGAVKKGCGGRWDERGDVGGRRGGGGLREAGAGGADSRRTIAGGQHGAVVRAVAAAAGGEMRAA